jgi:hypothetical protein
MRTPFVIFGIDGWGGTFFIGCSFTYDDMEGGEFILLQTDQSISRDEHMKISKATLTTISFWVLFGSCEAFKPNRVSELCL